MRAARNVAIVMALALPVAFLPNGENAAEALLAALTMGLLAGISWMLYTLSRQNQLTLATLSDGRRAIFYGGFGLIALLIAGADKMFATGGGTVLWLLLFATAAAAIWRIWMEANTLS
ncbi:MAG TPA: hypothetical protein VEP91_06240 [Solirubrobacterales bacterium]|nr:hypothetical protein [Solirubrobacterales bacterium]